MLWSYKNKIFLLQWTLNMKKSTHLYPRNCWAHWTKRLCELSGDGLLQCTFSIWILFEESQGHDCLHNSTHDYYSSKHIPRIWWTDCSTKFNIIDNLNDFYRSFWLLIGDLDTLLQPLDIVLSWCRKSL